MTSTKRPNLVFIFSDQQSRDMVGVYGESDVQTPHLDALAAQGITFDHCMSNAPVCTPYRSMLITGQHPLHNNCFNNDRRLLPDIGMTFAGALGQVGYRNGYIGKWHLQGGDRDRPVREGPDRHGFDDTFQSNNCAVNYDPDHAFYWEGDEKRAFGDWEVAGQTQQALDYLDRHSTLQPFSLFVSYHAPHNHLGGDPETYSGFDAPEQFKALYEPDSLRLRPGLPDNARTRRMVQGYLAMCSEVDRHVGRILERLEANGLADNTIVVYTSDHGETFGAQVNHWHKGSPEDISVRVPLIIRLPDGLGAGRRSGLLIGSLDLMPTILGLMEVDVPKACDGVDLSKAILTDDDDAVNSVPLFYFTGSWRGVYTRRWTYAIENIARPTRQGVQIDSDLGRTVLLRSFNVLYDRRDDPHQQLNLFGHAGDVGLREHLTVVAELHELTLDWLDHFGDPFLDQLEILNIPDDGRRPIDVVSNVPAFRPAAP